MHDASSKKKWIASDTVRTFVDSYADDVLSDLEPLEDEDADDLDEVWTLSGDTHRSIVRSHREKDR